MNIVEAVQYFISSGKYIEMVEIKRKLEIVREQLKQYQLEFDLKEMKWIKEGVIGYFESVRVFDEDKAGLIDYLFQIGALPLVVNMSWSRLSQDARERLGDWIEPELPVVQFTPTKNLRVRNDYLLEFSEWAKRHSLSWRVQEWKEMKDKYDVWFNEWKSLLHRLQYELKPKEKIILDIGSLSCKPRDPYISGVSVHQALGSEAVIQHGTVDHNKLRSYIARGLLKKSEVDDYRRVIDVKLRYVLKPLHRVKQETILHLQSR